MKTLPFANHFEVREISNDDEEQKIIDILSAVLEGLESTISPNTEIIVHDIRNPSRSTHTIVNGHVTGRKIGDPIIAAPVDDQGLDLLYSDQPPTGGISASLGSYESRTRDGRKLKSATVLFRNRAGKAFASVCTNTDLTEYQVLHTALQKLLGLDKTVAVDAIDTRPTVDELIDQMVNGAVDKIGKPVIMMDKPEKLQIVSELLKRGVFVIKGSVERVANSLSVTRFTVYNYLEELGYAGGAKAASLKVTKSTVKRLSTKSTPHKATRRPVASANRKK